MIEQRVRDKAIELAIKTMPSLIERAKKISTCIDKQVGVRLYSIDSNGSFRRIASGFNSPIDTQACCKLPCLTTHAEIRAIINLAQKGISPYIAPWLCISTLEPCYECVKALIYAGTKVIIFDKETNPSKSGIHVWAAHMPYDTDKWIQLGNCKC